MPISPLALSLVRPGGSGDASDAQLVAAELDRLPQIVLSTLAEQGMAVVACRGSITDHRRDLANEHPRGWPDGMTWSSVPGAYLPDDKVVCIATLPAAGGRRRVPPKGTMHSAWNLVVHETMHADDYLMGRLRSHNAAFLAARKSDWDSLDSYEQQNAAAGYEETYAESAARHFGADPSFAGDCPNLAAFWSNADLPIAPGPPPRRRRDSPKISGDTHIGTAELDASGVIRLDLRATSADGAIGHALVTLPPDASAYAAVDQRLGAARGKKRWTAASDPLLVLPFR